MQDEQGKTNVTARPPAGQDDFRRGALPSVFWSLVGNGHGMEAAATDACLAALQGGCQGGRFQYRPTDPLLIRR